MNELEYPEFSSIRPPLGVRTFSDVVERNAALYPEKVFCIEYPAGERVTFGQFHRYVNQGCHFLRERAVGKGDIVSVCIKNSLAFLIIYFACLRARAAVNPLPNSLSYLEIRKFLQFLPSKMLFVDESLRGKDFGARDCDFLPWEATRAFLEQISSCPQTFESRLDENDVACYYYSSGTTSNPKCIMYTHKNMMSLVGSMTQSFRYGPADVHLGFLPLGHTAITNYSMLPAVYNASRLVLCDNFMKIRPAFWKIVSEYEITYVETVPTVLVMMLNTPYADSDIMANRTLKYVGCGSAPLAVEIQKRFQERFRIPVVNLYGLSETGPTHFDDPFSNGWQPGSVGRVIMDCECKVLREDGREAAIGEVGEIAIKGDNVFVGYYKNEQAYREVMRDGFFFTGDLGYKDENGLLYFADRKKDLIIRGGVNILPAEIEEVLYQDDRIQLAVVIGVPDVVYGEDIIAFVKVKDQAAVAAAEIAAHCAANLQLNKCPKKILVVEDIPQGPSGKILRKEMRKRFAEGVYDRS